MNQFRQNTLLVVTTQENTETVEASSELKCFCKGLRQTEALRLFLSEYILFGKEKVAEEKRLAINLYYSQVRNLIVLKMIKLSPLELHSLETLVREINTGHKGLTNNAFLQSLHGSFLFPNKFEFFGKLRGQILQFTIKMTKREKKNHFQRYIGVGYKDKGTAKLESWDGFHSWQEITATGEAKLKEKIRANSFKLQGKEIKSMRCFEKVLLGNDNFGAPEYLHLELVSIDDGIKGFREFRPDERYREIILEKMSTEKLYSKRLVPARDNQGRYLYLFESTLQ